MLIPEIFPLLYSFLPAASSNCSRSELPSPNVGSVLLQMELGLVSLSEHSDVTMRGSHRCCLWKVCLQFRECWDTAMNSFSNFEGVPLTYLQWFWFSPSSACDREHSRSRPGLQSRSSALAFVRCGGSARRRALCSSGSHLPADSFHSFSSLKKENHLYNEREIQTVYRFSSTVEVCVWHEGCNLAFCSLNQIVFVFSVKLNCKNCLYNVKRL